MAYKFVQCEILDAATMYPSEKYFELEGHASPDWNDDSMAERAIQFQLLEGEGILFSGLIEFRDLADADKFMAPLNDDLVGLLLPNANGLEFLVRNQWSVAMHKDDELTGYFLKAQGRNLVSKIGNFEFWS